MANQKQHHYVPRFYLDRFTDPDGPRAYSGPNRPPIPETGHRFRKHPEKWPTLPRNHRPDCLGTGGRFQSESVAGFTGIRRPRLGVRQVNRSGVLWTPGDTRKGTQILRSSVSSRHSSRPGPGDRLLVSELSRLGRSLGQVIQIVETLVRRKIRFIAIKEAIEFDGKQDLRTKEGLAAAKAKGKRLGRPKGALGTSRLDGKEQDIRALLGKDVSKASIAKILDVSRSALYHFIQTRKIAPG